MMKQKLIFALGLLLTVLILCSPMQGFAADTIKIGATEPLSGTFKDIGERYLDGVQYAVKIINEGGGLLGKKVEVIPIDTELKPDVATRKAQNLILRDGVKFFCGGTGVQSERPFPGRKNGTLSCSLTAWTHAASPDGRKVQ